jgi:AAA domain
VIARESRDGVLIAEPIVKAIIENVRANDIALVIVDIGCHRIGESDNTKVEKVARQWARIAHETNAAVELVHHLRKNGNGAEPSAEDARGASALVNAARSVRILSTMSKEEGEAAGVEERRRFFKVASAKANLAMAPDHATWRELVSVSLGNGGDGPSDHVGVATDWQWPSAFDDVTPADLRAVQKAIAAGEWRADPQAKGWAGQPVADVLDLNLDDKFVKAKRRPCSRHGPQTGC